MDPIYLDYAATTPMRPEVRDAMDPFLVQRFGNPSSAHRWGREAQAALEEARARIAAALGVRRREVVFVRGGTEADNLAVLGRASRERRAGRRPRVVTTAVEHKAVLEAAEWVAADGGEAVVVPVDRTGTVEMDALAEALAEPACVLSVIWVNNEVGVVQPVEAIARLARAHGVPLHCDGVQAVGKVPVDLERVPVDLLTVTGHKIYGPKGTAALVVRDGVEVAPRLHGGGQEGGLRAGTQDVAGAVGLAEAVALAVDEQAALTLRLEELRTRLEGRLRAALPGLRVHGEGGERAPHVLNVGLPDVDAELLMVSLDMEGLAVSAGSACASGERAGSHVLAAMWGDEASPCAVRYSLGRDTVAEHVDRAAEITSRVVERLRGAPTGAA